MVPHDWVFHPDSRLWEWEKAGVRARPYWKCSRCGYSMGVPDTTKVRDIHLGPSEERMAELGAEPDCDAWLITSVHDS